MASQPLPPPPLGARFTLTAPDERYPHFIASVAATGTKPLAGLARRPPAPRAQPQARAI